MIEKDEQKYNADTELSSIPEVTPIELLPCPFCGDGETQFREVKHWTGTHHIVISVEINHWCEYENQNLVINVKGVTYDEVIARWNRRIK